MGYATFNFGTAALVPYFTIGAGAAHLDPKSRTSITDSETRFTAAIGGGSSTSSTPHFALRFDGRVYSTYLGDTEVLCGYYYICTADNWLTNAGANGGFIIAF